MAFRKKAWQDYLQGAFGQESETAQTAKEGLVVGGVYQSTAPTIADGEFARLQVDSFGNIKSGRTDTYLGNIIIAANKVVGTTTSTINGVTKWITITTPDLSGTSTGTATVRITDSLGGTLFEKAQAQSVTAAYGSAVPITTTMKLTATAEGTQAAAGTISLAVHYER